MGGAGSKALGRNSLSEEKLKQQGELTRKQEILEKAGILGPLNSGTIEELKHNRPRNIFIERFMNLHLEDLENPAIKAKLAEMGLSDEDIEILRGIYEEDIKSKIGAYKERKAANAAFGSRRGSPRTPASPAELAFRGEAANGAAARAGVGELARAGSPVGFRPGRGSPILYPPEALEPLTHPAALTGVFTSIPEAKGGSKHKSRKQRKSRKLRNTKKRRLTKNIRRS